MNRVSEWNMSTLGEVAELNPRLTESLQSNTPVSFIPMSAVTAETASTTTGEERKYSEVSKGYTPFRDGDVLVAKITHCFENGKIAQAKLTHPIGFGSTEFHVVRACAGKSDARYLLHVLRQGSIRADGARKMTGSAGQRRVPEHFLAGLQIPLPPLPEQRRIADVLDRAEALRAKRRTALALLDTLTQSIFLDMFGDPVTNPKGWPTYKVTELCDIVRGSSPRPQGDPRFFGGNVPRLMVADITRDGWLVTPRIDSLTEEGAKRSRPVSSGTVVMAVSGNIGLVSRLAIDACVHDGFVAFTHLKHSICDPGFLLATLHFSKVLHAKNTAGAIFLNLTTTDIKAMSLPMPSMILQMEFARRVAAVEQLRSAQRASLARMDESFASLQHRAFRGEL